MRIPRTIVDNLKHKDISQFTAAQLANFPGIYQNVSRKLKRSGAVTCALALTLLLSSGAVFAQDAMTKAIALFQKKDYQAASLAFRALADSKQGATAHYYLGLCYIQLGHTSHAKVIFERLIQIWPNSAEAKQASSYLNGAGAAASQSPAEKTADAERDKASSALAAKILDNLSKLRRPLTRAEWAKLPEKTRIPLERANGHLWVRAKINGQYCRVVFDTGAEVCTLSVADFPDIVSREQLKQGKTVGVQRVYGLIAGRMIETEISIQDVTRKIDTIFIAEPNCSLIGQNFFKEYSYQVDDYYLRLTKAPFEGDEQTAATRSSVSVMAKPDRNDKFSLPFEKLGNNMMVEILVNGHPIKACFDTGCGTEGLVIHPSMQGPLGVTSRGYGRGMADRVEVGHMIKIGLPVDYANGLSHPLIGPKVFNRGYTVDQQAKRIRFDY
ncbi:tetratricopeptide repeat protein [bacterium]|nr:tetratricopeptide repeat protein [bacterium]